MGHSQAEKAQSRERILAEAAKQIREAGLESVSVGKLMKSVNLTHGGFYGHFDSRSDLLAQALERALAEGEATARAASDASKPRSYATVVRSYLSRAHRDSRHSGCAVAALAGDVGRADLNSRAVMEEHIERFFRVMQQTMGHEDDSAAIFAVCAMIGGVTLSRVMTDPKRADAILRAVKEHVLAMESASSNAD
jgi:TetR/AcrR family transcriptional repressor of nem operon